MNAFFDRMSPRSLRILYSVVVLAALAIGLANFTEVVFTRATSNDQCAWRPVEGSPDRFLITDIVPGGVADRAGLQEGDVLLKINGRPFKGAGAAMYLINRVRAGEMATYLIERGGRQFEVRIEILKVIELPYLSTSLMGFGFLVVGFVVVMTRPQGRVQRMFARYSVLCMLLFSLASIRLTPDDPAWKANLMIGAFIVTRFFALPTFVRFFLRFPVERKLIRQPWFTALLYVISLLLVAPIILGRFSVAVPWELQRAAVYGPAVFFLGGLAAFAESYVRAVAPARKKQLRPILITAVIGGLSYIYTAVLDLIDPFVIFLRPALLLPALLLIAVPLGFGYSVFRYRLMDIDLVIRRSLMYGGITASVAAIYLALVFGVGSLLGELVGRPDNELLAVLALVLIAFLFDPIKRKVQDGVDRVFFRERLSYQKALREFSQELPRLMDLEHVLASIVHRIATTMHVDRVAVVLCDQQEGCHCSSNGIPPELCRFGDEPDGLLAMLRRERRPVSFELLPVEPEGFPIHRDDKRRLLESGIVLTVPMSIQDRLIGMIAVGTKRSGKVYSGEDRDLLETVAGQAATAIENARLHRSEIHRKSIEEELALARRIQEGLLPKKKPDHPRLDVAGISIPARTVGGDYFDFLELGNERLLVVVADVSGKGMSAALYMSKVQGMVQIAAHLYDSPREILLHVNRHIFDGLERNSFITMILALFDLRRNEVRICRAGHNKALIGAGGHVEYLDAPGIGLGLERGPKFEETLEEIRRPLAPGNVFFFYTDGLTETMNEEKEELGEAAVNRIVQTYHNLPAEELQKRIVTAAREFRGSAVQHDDLTLVLVRVMP